ncbi:MAG: hypothetical protein AAF393_02060 [Pseudomonadota bacterium]
MSQRLTWLALAGAVVPTIAIIVLTLVQTGGIWEYALDDVYIHLAMSEGVARGEYGVNVGEAASASSSILFSYLLAPLAGTWLHVWWPLVLGFLALVWAGWLWGGVLAEAYEADPTLPNWFLPVLALGAPTFMHFPAMAVIGMEHILHIAVTLAALLGLLRFARTGHMNLLLVAGLALNPLLRFEGMAILLLGVAVLALRGRMLAAFGILALGALPLAAHFGYMTSLGLDLLPNSVNAKAAVAGGGDREIGISDPSRVDQIILSWRLALVSTSGRMIAAAIAIMAFGLLAFRRQITGTYALIGWMAVIAMTGHILLGAVNWFYRYEVYVFTFAVGAGIVLLARTQMPARGAILTAFLLAFGYGGAHYLGAGFSGAPQGSAAIAAQQRQMARFVDDFWQAPIAVNDLGHVSFNNPHYVLDLWGLANARALRSRQSGDDPLWADKLADEYGVELAMIYPHWLGESAGPDWVHLADLVVTIPHATLGGPVVSIYATGSEAVPRVEAALAAFGLTLPHTTELKIIEVSQ